MYIVAEGSVEIAPVAVNPFDDVATRLASSGVVVPRTYVAHPGDVIGEVAAVVDALAGIRTRASLPNGVGLVAGEDLPRRAPARAMCSNDGPARLFAINSRDVERVLMFGGERSFADVQGGEGSVVGTLHAAVATRLAELEASANMSVDQGGDDGNGERRGHLGGSNPKTGARACSRGSQRAHHRPRRAARSACVGPRSSSGRRAAANRGGVGAGGGRRR